MVATLSDVIIQRLEHTIPMQQQVVSAEDRILLEEMQTSLISVILAIVQRFEGEIKPQADRIMSVLLQVLTTVGAKSSVPDVVFATVGAIASALEDDFIKYMESFSPFLYNALGNQEEPGLCSMAIGLVSDIARALNEKVQPYCDTFMNLLLKTLQVRLFLSDIPSLTSNADLPNRLPPTSSSLLFLRPSATLPRPSELTLIRTWRSLARFSSRPPASPPAPTSHTTWWIILFLSVKASWMLGVVFFCPTRALLRVRCSLLST